MLSTGIVFDNVQGVVRRTHKLSSWRTYRTYLVCLILFPNFEFLQRGRLIGQNLKGQKSIRTKFYCLHKYPLSLSRTFQENVVFLRDFVLLRSVLLANSNFSQIQRSLSLVRLDSFL